MITSPSTASTVADQWDAEVKRHRAAGNEDQAKIAEYFAARARGEPMLRSSTASAVIDAAEEKIVHFSVNISLFELSCILTELIKESFHLERLAREAEGEAKASLMMQSKRVYNRYYELQALLDELSAAVPKPSEETTT